MSAGLAAGLAPAEALRRARIEARETAPDALAEWAPLLVHVVGSGEALPLGTAVGELRTPSAGRSAGPWLAAAGALGLIALFLRRKQRSAGASAG